MGNLNIAVIGSAGYSRELGKKGTESDVTIYNIKKGEDTLTIMEPSRFPEKLAPLSYSVFFANYAILVIEQINASFGESLLMLDAVGPDNGAVILRNYITKEQIQRYTKGTRIANYEVMEDNVITLREKLWSLVPKKIDDKRYNGTVIVDHYFRVKGIGTVALGIVESGIINKHDNLMMLPGKMTVQIRSIQKHDQDFNTAVIGDRVGLALKNIEIENMDKGVVLTNDITINITKEIKGLIKLNKFWINPLKVGMPLHLGYWMQFISGKIELLELNGDKSYLKATISLEKELVYRKGSNILLTYLDGGNLRVMGTIKIE